MLAKILVSIAIFVSLASAFDVKDEVQVVIQECAKTYNIEIDQINKVYNANGLPQTENGKCFVECALEKLSVTVDGKINLSSSKELNAKLFKDPEQLKMINKINNICSKEVTKSAEKCSYGVELMACVSKYAKEMGFPKYQV